MGTQADIDVAQEEEKGEEKEMVMMAVVMAAAAVVAVVKKMIIHAFAREDCWRDGGAGRQRAGGQCEARRRAPGRMG